jgi:hypothetical protein
MHKAKLTRRVEDIIQIIHGNSNLKRERDVEQIIKPANLSAVQESEYPPDKISFGETKCFDSHTEISRLRLSH